MSRARAIFAILGLLAAGQGAAAADMPARLTLAPDSLWLGHFTGGRNLAPGVQPTALDWVDRYERFASLGSCAGWVRNMTRSYSTYQGWKGCVRLR